MKSTPSPSSESTLKALRTVDDLRGRLEGDARPYVARIGKGHLHEVEALHLAGEWITELLAAVQEAAEAVAAASTPR